MIKLSFELGPAIVARNGQSCLLRVDMTRALAGEQIHLPTKTDLYLLPSYPHHLAQYTHFGIACYALRAVVK